MGVADPLKPEAAAAVGALQAAGLPCHLLTGDNWVTARVVAAQLDICHVSAEVACSPAFLELFFVQYFFKYLF